MTDKDRKDCLIYLRAALTRADEVVGVLHPMGIDVLATQVDMIRVSIAAAIRLIERDIEGNAIIENMADKVKGE